MPVPRPSLLMAPIHNRMPVILPKGARDRWLARSVNAGELQALLTPFRRKRFATSFLDWATRDRLLWLRRLRLRDLPILFQGSNERWPFPEPVLSKRALPP